MSCVAMNWFRRKKKQTSTGFNYNPEQYDALIRQKNEQIDMLIKERNDCLLREQNKAENSLEAYWNNKYPPTIIRYAGRPLPLQKVNVEVPINLFITPNDPDIIKDLKDWGMYQTEEDPETLAPKIYWKIFKEYYQYKTDQNSHGVTELWQFPFELRKNIKLKKYGDCEDYDHLQMSYYIAAGIPEWRCKAVCGMTYTNFGHSTVYLLSKLDNKFHHLNSTYGGLQSWKNISDFPTHDDAKIGNDSIGIVQVWFSFNNKYMWSEFNQDLPEKLITNQEDLNISKTFHLIGDLHEKKRRKNSLDKI